MAGLSLQGAQAAAGSSGGGALAAAAPGGEQPQQQQQQQQQQQPVKRRKLSDYQLEPDLAREVDAALAAELSGAEGHRSSLHLVVAGHVDAGKSTLMGRLLHDLGRVSQKEAHRNLREATQAGKASFSWAWVLDERPEERARGVTVDVAMARFATPRYNVTLLDAPGHRSGGRWRLGPGALGRRAEGAGRWWGCSCL
ncbi:HBS1-like protein [Monoraphidium neglectum]|uniref:HBS1-like protein n=1 Tax=Monoraphidium neglectum TaxID=145388 RepID=A0A0D2KEQ1_9CHLO|nr:HBS1-like protein [Monoraphidium neglectum]KIY94333.1 HBS1-like protein [Monoraphidium neglectum]|eukprot:XP_013893353.1 HBS1-like protein [Monoraphidium neglectum]